MSDAGASPPHWDAGMADPLETRYSMHMLPHQIYVIVPNLVTTAAVN